MVKKGPFIVEIVDADTKQAFKEHSGPNDGRTYAEVEPDAEYFLRIKSEYTHGVVIVKYKVDGEDLGFQVQLSYGKEYTVGLWSQTNGKSMTKAFRFQKASVMDCAAAGEDGKPWTGNIEISFFNAVENGYAAQRDFQNQWGGGKVGTLLGQEAKKGVKSTVGSTVGSITHVEKKRKVMTYKTADKLDTVTLHYCTAVGLIFAGVLPRPPLWDLHRLQFPREADEDNKNSVERESTTSPVAVAGSTL